MEEERDAGSSSCYTKGLASEFAKNQDSRLLKHITEILQVVLFCENVINCD